MITTEIKLLRQIRALNNELRTATKDEAEGIMTKIRKLWPELHAARMAAKA